MNTTLYEQVESMGMLAKGKKELLKHLNGESLTIGQMSMANCYMCMGYYVDGKEDCGIGVCPLYPRMPYRKAGVVKRKKGKAMLQNG